MTDDSSSRESFIHESMTGVHLGEWMWKWVTKDRVMEGKEYIPPQLPSLSLIVKDQQLQATKDMDSIMSPATAIPSHILRANYLEKQPSWWRQLRAFQRITNKTHIYIAFNNMFLHDWGVSPWPHIMLVYCSTSKLYPLPSQILK